MAAASIDPGMYGEMPDKELVANARYDVVGPNHSPFFSAMILMVQTRRRRGGHR